MTVIAQTIVTALARVARLATDDDAVGLAEALVDLAVDGLAADAAAVIGVDDSGALQPFASRGVGLVDLTAAGGDAGETVSDYVERAYEASFGTRHTLELPAADRRVRALVLLYREAPESTHAVATVTGALVEIMAATNGAAARRSEPAGDVEPNARHELRNLLHGIGLNLELVTRCMPTDERYGHDAIAHIGTLLHRARALVT